MGSLASNLWKNLERKEMLAYLKTISEKMKLGSNPLEPVLNHCAARVSLQMLEVAIYRIKNHLPINDFSEDGSPQTANVTILRDAYRSYRPEQNKTKILLVLRNFNERYITFLIELGFREDFIRSTGTAE